MNAILNLGKYIWGIAFLGFAFGHFTGASNMAGIVPIPGGVFWVYLTGVCFLLAAISIFIGKYDKLANFLLGLLLLIIAFSIHLTGFIGGDQAELPAFLKALAMGGAAWAYARYAAADPSGI